MHSGASSARSPSRSLADDSTTVPMSSLYAIPLFTTLKARGSLRSDLDEGSSRNSHSLGLKPVGSTQYSTATYPRSAFGSPQNTTVLPELDREQHLEMATVRKGSDLA